MSSRSLAALAMTGLVLTAAGVDATCTSASIQELTNPSGASFHAFGRAVAVSGDLAVVTADGEGSMGAAYAYRRQGGEWVGVQRVVPPDLEPVDLFGASAALLGSTLFVGNPFDDDDGVNTGSVWRFAWDGAEWVAIDKLTASDAEEFDQFGESIAYDGTLVVVGAINEDGAGQDRGAAYVFRHDGVGWVEEQKLTASTPDDLDQFGWDVAVDGDVIVVSAVNDDDLGADSGAVYVFEHDGVSWTETAKLTAGDGAAGDWFGWAIDLDGTRLAVGATQHDLPVDSAGALYLLDSSAGSWDEVAKLAASDVAAFDNTGWDVDLDGDRLLVGAVGSGNGAGALYLFQENATGWVESHRWISSGPPGGGFLLDNLGSAVALDGAFALGGAPFGNDDAGAVSAFDLTDLALDATPDAVAAGGNLELQVCGGQPGEPAGVQLFEANGNPVGLVIGTGTFDAEGRFTTLLAIPPGAGGNVVTFRAAGRWRTATVGRSNLVTVAVQP